ncbi:MAG: hypothetical protein HZA91_06730 [Verrucomicrobia bacterium]|nr:hypothetical protein [Verrucomicrobiota bacterium]
MRPCLRTLVFLLAFTLLAFAGEIRTFNCTNTQCNFKAKVFCGSGDAVTKVSGYCTRCGKMVTATFPNKDSKGFGPNPVARVWDSATGKTLDVFGCPDCKRPFAPVEGMKHCPKCRGKTIAEGVPGLWD